MTEPPNLLLPPLTEAAQAKDEEVQRAGSFTDAEKQILVSAKSMPVDRLAEIITVYERLSNQGMMDALVRVLIQRAPNHPDAMRLRNLVETHEEVRDPGFIDRVIKKLNAGEKLIDPEADALSAYVGTIAKEGAAQEGIRLLQQLEKTTFPNGQFNPYRAGLAFAYRADQRYDEALEILAAVVKDKRYTEATRLEAQRAIPQVKLDKRIFAARQEAKKDYERALELSAEILADGGKTTNAIPIAKQAVDSLETLIKALPPSEKLTPERRMWESQLAQLYGALGHTSESAGKKAEAKVAFAKAVATWEKLAAAIANDEAIQAGLTWSKGRLAKIK
jgi:tetratricopeptide (TPR) repeat protein